MPKSISNKTVGKDGGHIDPVPPPQPRLVVFLQLLTLAVLAFLIFQNLEERNSIKDKSNDFEEEQIL